MSKKDKKAKKEKKAKKTKKEKRSKKEENEKGSRKRKRHFENDNEQHPRTCKTTSVLPSTTSLQSTRNKCYKNNLQKVIPFPYKYILAPMVGASELPFRLLCRKYGAQVAYTPMISSVSFVESSSYRSTELQTTPQDRPLVVHFSANNPKTFAKAAKMVEHQCDAIDLNLGCPQRTAYIGHFGSYLLDEKDRELIVDIVKAGNEAVRIPIFVKIRLLDTLEKTILLVKQLRDAGASLVAIHARYRASHERKGSGARDGPALLDQVLKIKQVVTDIPIIANGNIITYQDVEENLDFTNADGVMSAEGILDNPALFLPQLGSPEDRENVDIINIALPSKSKDSVLELEDEKDNIQHMKKKRKLMKKMREIEKIEDTVLKSETEDCINEEQKAKLANKVTIKSDLLKLEQMIVRKGKSKELVDKTHNKGISSQSQTLTRSIPLQSLYDSASDDVKLALEYLNLTKVYPATIRTQIFHTRRICRDLLKSYQLMEECVGSKTTRDLENVLSKMEKYRKYPDSFQFDKEKQKKDELALQRKRIEEGKRKSYEARMIRKAKREGKSDLEFYLRQGVAIPTVDTIKRLRILTRDKQLEAWKFGNHSQHCMAFHLGNCKRDRSCAFLHVNAKGTNAFIENEEVAG